MTADPAPASGPGPIAFAPELRIASVGSRARPGVIDVILVVVAGIVYTLVFGSDQPRSSVSMSVNNHVVNGAGVVAFQILALAYFYLTEARGGATVGKRLTGLRVVSADGGRPSTRAIAIRTLLRPVDGIPWVIPNLLGFAVLASGPSRQRIGDRLADTLVVHR